jgi:4-diphosphocytidyl-2-C-methyl-D-erythritol kinase
VSEVATIIENAYAKINLALDVLDKRPDGYHNIKSVMQTVSLCDRVTVTSGTGEGIRVTCDCAALPQGQDNLAYRAAEVFFQETGKTCDGVDISIEKHIPSEAGLGGGSADAAAVLRAMRKLYDPMLPISRLQQMAAKIGSDVPFCVRGGTALIRGRGEEILKLSALPPCSVVLCKPELCCSTARMYALLDEKTVTYHPDTAGLTKALEVQDRQDISERIGNVFEQILPPGSEIFAIRAELLRLGARAACMSGSGSAVFGIFFEDQAGASAAAQKLQEKYSRTYLTGNV